jgi:predicted PurR-regulated permease PerM
MKSNITSYFFFALLLCVVITSALIFWPFVTPLLLGAAAAVIAYPLYSLLLGKFKQGRWRKNIAALTTTLLILIVILIPLFFLIAKIYSEVQSLYLLLIDETGRSQVISALNALSKTMSHTLFDAFPAYSFDSLNVTEYLKSTLVWIFSNLDKVFSSIAMIAAYAFVFLLSTFYFLRDGAVIKSKFVAWSPLLDTHDEYISATMKRAIKSVFVGTITVSVVQGIMTGIGFLIFGIPAPSVWGSVASVASLIPGVGTSLVIIPGILYLLFVGNYLYALGLLLWGMIAVGLIDNFLGPYMVNRGIDAHPFLILISVLGGLVTFGMIGFVLGPLVLALLFALMDIYKTSFSNPNQPSESNK